MHNMQTKDCTTSHYMKQLDLDSFSYNFFVGFILLVTLQLAEV